MSGQSVHKSTKHIMCLTGPVLDLVTNLTQGVSVKHECQERPANNRHSQNGILFHSDRDKRRSRVDSHVIGRTKNDEANIRAFKCNFICTLPLSREEKKNRISISSPVQVFLVGPHSSTV